MRFGVGNDGVTERLEVMVTEANLAKLREGIPLYLQFRNGARIPIDLVVRFYDSEEAAQMALDALGEAPGCIHDKESAQAKGLHPTFGGKA